MTSTQAIVLVESAAFAGRYLSQWLRFVAVLLSFRMTIGIAHFVAPTPSPTKHFGNAANQNERIIKISKQFFRFRFTFIAIIIFWTHITYENYQSSGCVYAGAANERFFGMVATRQRFDWMHEAIYIYKFCIPRHFTSKILTWVGCAVRCGMACRRKPCKITSKSNIIKYYRTPMQNKSI